MEKPLFPSKTIRITQGYKEGTHKDSYAIDNADKDSGISPIYAPFTGVIKKIYKQDANEVWLESLEPVEYSDGTKDYLNILFAHADNVDNLFVGKIIKKGEIFYKEGTKGNASGNHCHIECGRGKFTGTGWHKNNSGYWSINDGIAPESCLWVDESINILNDYGYKFKKIPTTSVEKEEVDEEISEEKTPPITKLTFTAPKTALYGVYLNKDDILKIES